jgi:hypothetical protein
MVDVPNIEIELLFPRERIAAVDLGPTRYTRLDLMPPPLICVVARNIFRQQRPWPNQTHVALEDVPKLWQLIQAKTPQFFPEAGHAIRIGQQTASRIACICHRSELVKLERLVMQSDALVTEYDRPPKFDSYGDCHEGCDRAGGKQQRRSNHKVKDALYTGHVNLTEHTVSCLRPT